MVFIKLFGGQAVEKKYKDKKIEMADRAHCYQEAFENITADQ